MTNVQKNEVLQMVHREKERLGSYRAVANKCGVSETAINLIINGQYSAKGDDMWHKLAAGLNYQRTGWQVVETTNYKMVHKVLHDAKQRSMFIAISHKAGSGKSAPINAFANAYAGDGVYLIRCREWSKRDFLLAICRTLGIDAGSGYLSPERLSDLVMDFFQLRSHSAPLFIVDEADKLKPAALRFLIPLYNDCEGSLGVVIAGTENLEKEIKQGVRYNRKGFDEIDSRFGRQYVHLIGSNLADVRKICEANGITDKALQQELFNECSPVKKELNNQTVTVIEDLRRLKRVVERELLRSQLN